MLPAVAALPLLGLLIAPGSAWRSEGELGSASSFVEYAGKFCFDYVVPESLPREMKEVVHDDAKDAGLPDAGIFDFIVRGQVQQVPIGPETDSATANRLWLMIFDDREEHWPAAQRRWDELTCEERGRLSTKAIDLTPLSSMPFINMTIRVHQFVRPRWWHFVFVNCGAQVLQPLSYELHAVNPSQGLEAEFGVDARGSLALQACFAVLFALSAAAPCLLARRSMALAEHRTRPRPWLSLVQFSATLSAAGCALLAIHHAFFSFTGRGPSLLTIVAAMSTCVAKLAITVLSVFLAKGWALLVSTEEHSAPRRFAVAAPLIGIALLSLGCELYQEFHCGASAALYLYETWSGLCILGLNLCLLVLAWVLMFDTYRRERSDEVRRFYQLASAATGFYYASLPVVCVLAAVLDPWVRRKVVERTELCTRFAAVTLLLICLWPSHLDALISSRLKGATGRLQQGEDPEASDAESALSSLAASSAAAE